MENKLTVLANAEATTFKTKSQGIKVYAMGLFIDNFEDVKLGEEYLKQSQHLEKEITNAKDVIKKDALAFCKYVDQAYKDAVTPALEAKAIIKEKIVAFKKHVDELKREEIRKREEEAAKQNVPVSEIQVEVVNPLLKEDVKIKGMRTTIKYRIVDELAIPREYLIPDLKKIGNESKLGVVIPGIELFKEETVQ